MTQPMGAPWRVRRTAGLLVPGFTKRFAVDGASGMTYLLGVPIGRFDVSTAAPAGDLTGCELRYRGWPVVDVLEQVPAAGGSIRAAGYVRGCGDRQMRFCRFHLERCDTPRN